MRTRGMRKRKDRCGGRGRAHRVHRLALARTESPPEVVFTKILGYQIDCQGITALPRKQRRIKTTIDSLFSIETRVLTWGTMSQIARTHDHLFFSQLLKAPLQTWLRQQTNPNSKDIGSVCGPPARSILRRRRHLASATNARA